MSVVPRIFLTGNDPPGVYILQFASRTYDSPFYSTNKKMLQWPTERSRVEACANPQIIDQFLVW